MNVQVNEREALLIVTALGVYQNRVGQHTSWKQRKRMPTLRARLAELDDFLEGLGLYFGMDVDEMIVKNILNET